MSALKAVGPGPGSVSAASAMPYSFGSLKSIWMYGFMLSVSSTVASGSVAGSTTMTASGAEVVDLHEEAAGVQLAEVEVLAGVRLAGWQ